MKCALLALPLLLPSPGADAVSLRSLRAEAEQPGLPSVPPAAFPAGGPAPAPAAAPGPAPWIDDWNFKRERKPLNKGQCKELEKAILTVPAAMCKETDFAFQWDGCVCTIQLPNNINPLPDLGFNPFPEGIMGDENVPTEPPLEIIAPPTNPAQPYVAPPMKPQCPYSKSCLNSLPLPSIQNDTNGTNGTAPCVGYDSWGFAEVHMGKYSPASHYLNTITCSYIMKPEGEFVAAVTIEPPAEGVELAAVEHQRVELQCASRSINGTLAQLCSSALASHGATCQTTWSGFFGGKCEVAPPPPGFALLSTFQDMCPHECKKKLEQKKK